MKTGVSNAQCQTKTICHTWVDDSSAWTKTDFDRDDSWIITLTSDEIDELHQAIQFARRHDRSPGDLTKSDFPLKDFALKLANCLHDVQYARGFVLLRGMAVSECSEEDAELLFRGIGTYLDNAVSQNANGDLLGHVRDSGYADYRGQSDIRGYQTRANLEFHTDVVDVVGLMCLRPAKEGGESLIVSSITVHNELLKLSSPHLGLLYGNFLFDRRGEERAGEPLYFVSPLYSFYEGVLSCRPGLIDYIFSAEKKTGIPLSPAQREALDLFVEQTLRPELQLSMKLQAGDIQLLNNSVILHSRTSFVDHKEAGRKRHLLRLWVNVEHGRPVDPDAFPYRNGVPVKTRLA
ncbi:TauD/TfdA family dioxygenase [Acidiphilium iwatense]|uniref:TauD/TfdA family dioxygenase n=1 Tax=Acidiphilium iwatense TaxID=768198 RepID=A0ABS9E0X6_9PROT|nr:TauD/TfdA family dioxygenase [Acidiphilium iwatense]MCF3948652.1 TauD/TfdA family dioxygenase [Acidiphilium iwatense]